MEAGRRSVRIELEFGISTTRSYLAILVTKLRGFKSSLTGILSLRMRVLV